MDAAGKSFLIPSDISEAVMQWCPTVIGDSLPQQPVEVWKLKRKKERKKEWKKERKKEKINNMNEV